MKVVIAGIAAALLATGCATTSQLDEVRAMAQTWRPRRPTPPISAARTTLRSWIGCSRSRCTSDPPRALCPRRGHCSSTRTPPRRGVFLGAAAQPHPSRSARGTRGLSGPPGVELPERPSRRRLGRRRHRVAPLARRRHRARAGGGSLDRRTRRDGLGARPPLHAGGDRDARILAGDELDLAPVDLGGRLPFDGIHHDLTDRRNVRALLGLLLVELRVGLQVEGVAEPAGLERGLRRPPGRAARNRGSRACRCRRGGSCRGSGSPSGRGTSRTRRGDCPRRAARCRGVCRPSPRARA